MKTVLQVVDKATLTVNNKTISKIGKGLVVFFCVELNDVDHNLDFFAKKIANLRIFADENGKTNLSVKDISGEVLLVSQFTLSGDYQHGNRPSFSNAENPTRAKQLYEKLAQILQNMCFFIFRAYRKRRSLLCTIGLPAGFVRFLVDLAGRNLLLHPQLQRLRRDGNLPDFVLDPDKIFHLIGLNDTVRCDLDQFLLEPLCRVHGSKHLQHNL